MARRTLAIAEAEVLELRAQVEELRTENAALRAKPAGRPAWASEPEPADPKGRRPHLFARDLATALMKRWRKSVFIEPQGDSRYVFTRGMEGSFTAEELLERSREWLRPAA
jgi:hypothetical protein